MMKPSDVMTVKRLWQDFFFKYLRGEKCLVVSFFNRSGISHQNIPSVGEEGIFVLWLSKTLVVESGL